MVKFKKILICVLMTFHVWVFASSSDAKPQRLKTKNIFVCGKKIKAEIAQNPESRTIGLMNRVGVPKGTGMIFVFPNQEPRQFWMRNVPFSIDIAYFDSKGKFLNSMTMLGTSPLVNDERLPRYASEGPAMYAVEVEEGFFSKIKNLKTCQLSPLLKAQN